MIEIRQDALVFSFPNVHPEARCSIIFQRTLRLPDDKGTYPVPPGLGRFPLAAVREYDGHAPEGWNRENSAFLPMYQAEALLIIFVGWYPCAVKVAAGGINAVTGRRLRDERLWRPRDYVVVPRQPWMEWFCVGNGKPQQFLAMPLGRGREDVTSESQKDIHIRVYPMKAEHYRTYRKKKGALMCGGAALGGVQADSGPAPMWLLHRSSDCESYGFGTWDVSTESRCTVYPVNSLGYHAITGRRPPGKPPTIEEYIEAGLPWFDSYGTDGEALAALTSMDSWRR